MKKKNVALLALAGLMAGACTTEKQSVSGEITGVENDTLLVFISDPVGRKQVRTDTIPLVDHKFSISLPDSALLSVAIVEKPSGNNAMRMMSSRPLLWFAGDQIKVQGTLDELQVSGTELYDELNKLMSIKEIEDENMKLGEKFYELAQDQEKNKAALDSLQKVAMSNMEALEKERLAAIKANPNTLTAGYQALYLSGDSWAEAYQALGDEVKNGPLGKMLAQNEERYQKNLAREKAAENIKAGKPAPDFKLKNLKGEEMTLASFSGKYMLLDFWGSWCGWCIKGFPDMKKYYAKYKSKVEFVGIDCGDTEEKWRKCVEENQLPWTQLFTGKDDQITTDYAISGYPTKILIDPKGVIVEVFVGESPEMYKKLDELFK